MSLNFHRLPKLHSAFVFLFLMASFLPAATAGDEFELDARLQPAFDFWVDVFTKYGEDVYLIHDELYLSAVYEVLNFTGSDLSPAERWKRVKSAQSKWENALRQAYNKRSNPEKMTAAEAETSQIIMMASAGVGLKEAPGRLRIQKGAREKCLEAVIRSGKYLPRFIETFQSHNLPIQLAALPFVESSFRQDAVSPSGAVGMWQFMGYTGVNYMRINRAADERLDPFLAADAAARLLQHNYSEVQSWPFAVTAYNYGLNGMMMARQEFGPDLVKVIFQYKGSRFGFAARNFWVELLAAVEVMSNYRDYYGPVERLPEASFHEFALPHHVMLRPVMDGFNVDKSTLSALNPALKSGVLEGKLTLPMGYRLRLPADCAGQAERLYEAISEEQKKASVDYGDLHEGRYVVRKGDSIGKIAKRFGVSVQSLKNANRLQNVNLISVGQKLIVPL